MAALAQPTRSNIQEKSGQTYEQKEFEFLLACCSGFSDQKRTARLQEIISKGMDWERLLQLAEAHGIAPLMLRKLSGTWGTLPENVLRKLQQLDQNNSRRA